MTTTRASQVSLRLRVRLHSRSLDRLLAEGNRPEESPELALRAVQLVSRRSRRTVARSLRSLVYEAEHPAAVLHSAVPVCRRAVLPWREALLGLADRLRAPAEINPRGVARVMVVLGDGFGPLYNRAADRPLGDALWWVADGLQQCPPHAWDSPVIAKLDPEHVDWTCRHCGAIAMTDDPAVRPA